MPFGIETHSSDLTFARRRKTMSVAQLEQRVSSLEKAVERLQAQLARQIDGAAAPDSGSVIPDEEELIPGAEYDLVLNVPPKKVTRLKGKLRWIRPGPGGLALSDAEWASLNLEADDE
jgi:hypothetical protein